MGVVLVTGRTGQVGGAVIGELVRGGTHTRAMVRMGEQTAFADRGVEAVGADLERPETLPGALEGVDRAFLVSRYDPRQLEMEGAIIEAAVRAGVGRIAASSTEQRPCSPRVDTALLRILAA